MRKIFVLLGAILLIMSVPVGALAEKDEKLNDMYEEYRQKAMNYTDSEITKTDSVTDFIDNITQKYGTAFKIDIKSSLFILALLIILSLISSVLISFITNAAIVEIARFSSYCISALFILVFFKSVAEECSSGIKDLTDFMTVSFPVFSGIIASGGYVSTASSMQINFTVVSVFLTQIINNILIPLLYSCGLLSITDAMTSTANINQFISLVRKIIKYIIGLSLTVFAGILTFTGFTSITADNLAMKTAKYAVANFVPVVGACLSEALSSMMHSSVILKNSVGIVGFSAIIAICFYPIAKTAIYVLVFKLSASVLTLMSAENISKVAESMSDILEMMMGIFLIITVVFVLVITIIISTGM